MVGDGNGGVPPLDGPLHRILGVGEGIHQGHLGVEVELHPLFRGVVLLHGFFRGLDDQGSRTMSLSNRLRFSRPEIFRCMPTFTPLTMGVPSSPGMNLLTRMELV